MKKQNQEKPETVISESQIKSSKRMQILSKHISEAIRNANEEIEDEFTLIEVVHVFNQNANTYVRHGLKQEWS